MWSKQRDICQCLSSPKAGVLTADNKNRSEMSADINCFTCIQFTVAFKG